MLGDALPSVTRVNGNPHMLAYITPEEAAILRARGGGVTGGGGQLHHNGIPAFDGGGDSQNGVDWAGASAAAEAEARKMAEEQAQNAALAEQQRVLRLQGDVGGALQNEFGRLFSDEAIGARTTEFFNNSAPALMAARQTALDSSLGALHPDLRASPLGNQVAAGVNAKAATAAQNVWNMGAQESQNMRQSAAGDLAQRLGRVTRSADPWGMWDTERTGLQSMFTAPGAATDFGDLSSAASAAPWTGQASPDLGGASPVAREGLFSSRGSSRLVR